MLFQFDPTRDILPGQEKKIAEISLSANHMVAKTGKPTPQGVVSISGLASLGLLGNGGNEPGGFDAVTFTLQVQEQGGPIETIYEYRNAPYKLIVNVPIVASFKIGSKPIVFSIKAGRSNDPHPSASQWPAQIYDCQLNVSIN